MKVLIITEKLDKNDETTSFFHGRLLDFANECEALSVVVLENRSHSLPEKVEVFSLGKEKKISKVRMLINFYIYILKNRKRYDHIFVYRNPIYIVLGGLFWRLMGKEITLWYSHTYSDTTLRIAVLLANVVISPTKENFPFKTKKLKIINNNELGAYVCHLKSII